jgi:hypothetical protein
LITFNINAGASNGGRSYIILGSISGTEPGTSLPGGKAVLPVNWDAFTGNALGLVNTGIFQKFMGTLSKSGTGAALLNFGPMPGTAGLVMSYAYALNNPWDYVSNGVNIEIIP